MVLHPSISNQRYRIPLHQRRPRRRDIFEQGKAEHYSNYVILIMTREKLWNAWKQFIHQNVITSELLINQNFLYDNLQSAIKYMTTPCLAPPDLARKMAGLRMMARFIAIEGESVWGLMQEAVIRLDERNEGHESEGQFPSFSTNIDISNADVLESDDDGEEEADEVLEGHIRDSSAPIGTAFDPIWIRGEDFEKKCPRN